MLYVAVSIAVVNVLAVVVVARLEPRIGSHLQARPAVVRGSERRSA